MSQKNAPQMEDFILLIEEMRNIAKPCFLGPLIVTTANATHNKEADLFLVSTTGNRFTFDAQRQVANRTPVTLTALPLHLQKSFRIGRIINVKGLKGERSPRLGYCPRCKIYVAQIRDNHKYFNIHHAKGIL